MQELAPDALADALGYVVAELRHQWHKELEILAAEQRAQIAELRTHNLELRADNAELREALKVEVATELEKVRAIAAGLKNGSDGAPGAPGEQGPPGPAPDYGIVLERSEPLIKNLIAARWDDWTKTLPLPERGEKGERGEIGPAGKDADEDALVERVLQLLPAPERGEPGAQGEPGLPGKDADPEIVAALVLERLPPPERGEKGDPGEPGPKGESGQDADADLVAQKLLALMPVPERGEKGDPGRDGEVDADMLKAIVAQEVALIPRPKDGEPGPAGERGADGKDVDFEQVAAFLDQRLMKALEALPPAEKGEKGDPGDAGPAGRDGLEGPAGRDGIGMAGGFIDREGNLVLTTTDGTVRTIGHVVGKDGAPGIAGRDGKDGISFADFELEPEYDGERTVRLKWQTGDKAHVREWRFPVILDRGVYRADAPYTRGDAVSFGGSIWIAQTDTTAKPGNGCEDWRLAVKKGRDGRDGEKGERGERGAEGRPGVDWTALGPRGGEK